MKSQDPALVAFERFQRRRYLAHRTVSNRRLVLVRYLGWCEQTGRLASEAGSSDIEEWLDGCRLGARSRANYLSILNAFYGWWVEADEQVGCNPVSDIRPPRGKRLVPRPITDADLTTALAAAPPRELLWLCLGAFQGLRCVEMAGLVRDDLLEIEQALVVRQGKGGHQRVLPLHSDTWSAAQRFGLPPRGNLFRLQNGRAMREQTISSYIGRFFHHLDIDASAHQLRHWFGSRLYEDTKDLRLTQEMLGHASPTTTAIYVAYSRSSAQRAVRGLAVRPPLAPADSEESSANLQVRMAIGSQQGE